jgi:hypothetical protein
MADETDRDPASPTPEELRETAGSEGLMAGEEETDPTYVEDEEVEGGVDLESADGSRPYDPSPADEAPPAS